MTSLFGSLTLEELFETEKYARLITFRKIPMILMYKLKNLAYYIYCNYSAILFVKIFHTFLDELNPTPFFININPKGCHYYRIDSIAERGTQNG